MSQILNPTTFPTNAHQLLAQRRLAGKLLAEDGPYGKAVLHQLLGLKTHAKTQLPAEWLTDVRVTTSFHDML